MSLNRSKCKPMDDAVLDEFAEASQHLHYVVKCHLLLESLIFPEHLMEGAVASQLLENVDVIGSLLDIDELDYVGRFQILHDFDFSN